ncbi:tyrosine-type recombinase/integrase [Acidithiobacillus thiooxidans]|uniref:tyrosine-type recombinase/integrase n=1 Tax=Acidithiobacillus thiooxidans TaxID=930 RepID=UPI001C06CE48
MRDKSHISAYCLQFTILTAARSGESRGATREEFDLDTIIWTIPGMRMKAAKPHRVPLSDAAMAFLNQMQAWRMDNNPGIFPGARGGSLSDVAVNKVLHSVITDVTVHGFRSSFRDWGAEQTHFPAAVLDQALAHTNPNKIEAAYQRSDLFDLRRKLIQMWAEFATAAGS